MNNKLLQHTTALAASLVMAMPIAAHAHRTFLLPSTTLTNANSVVTIDGSASEELFNLDHALALDNVTVSGPDGVAVTPENKTSGKQRNSFELKLPKDGTYKVSLVSDGLNAMYKVDGQMKRWRGNADDFAKNVPADAQDLNVTRAQNRVETFVTAGEANKQAWTTTGAGLEMVPLNNPTELFTGDTSSFRFLLNGKPAADLMVTIIRGGNRYRDALGEITLKTDQDGKVSIKWPNAGMYWLGTNTGRPQPGTTGTLAQPLQRASYSATLEVLQP
jgi:uncharacterized GH25 family protein